VKERAVRDSVLVRVIKQALPYLRQHRRQVMVIKLGGELAGNPDALRSLAEDISLLLHVGVRLVVVHGGGPQATEVSKRLGLTPTMVEGRRVTDEQTLDVAKMVFAGKINTDILSALRAQGVRAVGLSGVDADIVSAARRKPTEMRDEATGETKLVDGSLLLLLMENGYVPVLASLGADSEGEILNINADTVASVIAQDLRAGKLISLTAVPGVLKDKDDPTTMIPLLTTAQARALLEGGTVGGGMRPKIKAVVEAVEGGVRRGHILSGLTHGSILLELFTREGSGTLIVGEHEAAEAAADAAANLAATASAEHAGRLPAAQRASGRPALPNFGSST